MSRISASARFVYEFVVGDDASIAGVSPIAKTALGRCHNNLFQTRYETVS